MNRVWIFTINKALEASVLHQIENLGQHFVQHWTAHDQALAAQFYIEKQRLLVVKVNEAVYAASGCSIDKLTRFVKQLETDFQIQLLNRLLVAYPHGNGIEVVPSSSIKTLLANQTLTPHSPIYVTDIATEAEQNNWLQPLKDTWLKKYL